MERHDNCQGVIRSCNDNKCRYGEAAGRKQEAVPGEFGQRKVGRDAVADGGRRQHDQQTNDREYENGTCSGTTADLPLMRQ